jgi:hypothetical protein
MGKGKRRRQRGRERRQREIERERKREGRKKNPEKKGAVDGEEKVKRNREGVREESER